MLYPGDKIVYGCVIVFDKTALGLIGALNEPSLGLQKMCSADSHWKFIKIVTDGHSVNKLAVKMLTV